MPRGGLELLGADALNAIVWSQAEGGGGSEVVGRRGPPELKFVIELRLTKGSLPVALPAKGNVHVLVRLTRESAQKLTSVGEIVELIRSSIASELGEDDRVKGGLFEGKIQQKDPGHSIHAGLGHLAK